MSNMRMIGLLLAFAPCLHSAFAAEKLAQDSIEVRGEGFGIQLPAQKADSVAVADNQDDKKVKKAKKEKPSKDKADKEKKDKTEKADKEKPNKKKKGKEDDELHSEVETLTGTPSAPQQPSNGSTPVADIVVSENGISVSPATPATPATPGGQAQKVRAQNGPTDELTLLREIKDMWVEQLVKNVSNKWQLSDYSNINIEDLEADYTQCERFAEVDARVKACRDKLAPIYEECSIYQEGKACVESPYVAENVTNARNKVKGLMDKVSGSRKKELSVLYGQLNDYRACVRIFQQLIAAVDARVESMGNVHAQAIPLVNAEIKKQEKDDENITAIKSVPWLKVQYEGYYNSLQKNCTAPCKEKSAVMQLVP